MVDIKKIISYLIPLFFLVIMGAWLFAGSFPGLKEKVYNLKTYVNFGAETEIGSIPTIPPDHADAIDGLIKTIKEMHESAIPNCFANYGKLPDLGEKGTSIHFQYDPLNDKTLVTVKGGKEGEQIISLHEGKGTIELPGVRSCVVAGGTVPGNFFDTFLHSIYPSSFSAVGTTFVPANLSLSFFNPSINNKGNIIKTGLLDVDDNDNYRSGGWLFTSNNKDICFFPTTYDLGAGCKADSKGIRDSCFISSEKDYSISKLIGSGELTSCRQYRGFRFVEGMVSKDNIEEVDGTQYVVGHITARCPLGETCHTYNAECNNRYEDTGVGRSDNGENCRLLVNFNKKCGYMGMKPGTLLGYAGNRANVKLMKYDFNFVGGDQAVHDLISSTGFMVGNDRDSIPGLECSSDGNWTIFDISKQIPKGTFPSEGDYSRDCEDGRDNNGNGLTDCADPACFGFKGCPVNDNEMGPQHEEDLCIDDIDNDHDGKIDCADPDCEGIKNYDRQCLYGNLITITPAE